MEISEKQVEVETLSIQRSDSSDSILAVGDTCRYSVVFFPENTTDRLVRWSVLEETGTATITQDGLFTAFSAGKVWVKVDSDSGNGVSDSLAVIIGKSLIPAESLTAFFSDPGDTLCMVNDNIQFEVEILPPNASAKGALWSVISLDGEAEIDTAGKMTATAPGIVRVKAVLEENPALADSLLITIIEGYVPVESLTVQTAGGRAPEVDQGDSLQLSVRILPVTASYKEVLWDVNEKQGRGTVSESGLLTALFPGHILIRAVSGSNPSVSDSLLIDIKEKPVGIEALRLVTNPMYDSILTPGDTLRCNVVFIPANTSDQSVLWSVTEASGQAIVDQTGLLTALSPGRIQLKCSLRSDPEIFDIIEIVIHERIIPLESIALNTPPLGDSVVLIHDTPQVDAAIRLLNATNNKIQ